MKCQQALDGIPEVWDDVTSKRHRTSRLDNHKPIGFSFHISEVVKEGNHEEGNGIANEKPCRSGLNLRDNPIRMRNEEQDHHQYAQSYHGSNKLERIFAISPMYQQDGSEGSRYTQSMVCHITW